MLKLITLTLTFIFINLFCFAQDYKLVGVVYKQVENYFYGKVYTLLNKGDILDVYRGNQKVGKVKIEQIDENKNVLLVVMEGQVSSGDSLYFVYNENKTEVQVSDKEKPINYPDSNLPYDKISDGLKYYSQVLAGNTKVIKFGPNSQNPTKVVIDPTQIFLLYSQYENYKMISDISSVSSVASSASTFY
ncbi:MAG: hypothetical protein ACK4ZM_04200, partial [bacterium]